MMAFSMMMMFPMMVALDVFLVLEFVRQEIFHCPVCLAAAAAVKGNACIFQAFLGSSADTAADYGFRSQLPEYPHQGTMALSLSAAYLRLLHFSVSQVIDLEILSPAKMLENFTVFRIIGYCKFHFIPPV